MHMNSLVLLHTIDLNDTITLAQHEYDHIEGVLYIDRLARGERKKVQGRLDELIKDYGYGRTL